MADKKKNFSQKTAAPQKAEKKYIDLFYMTPRKVTAKEIAERLQERDNLTVELWAEMNVLELVLPNQNSIDFEPVEADFRDASDAAFIKNRNIATIFAINLCEADLTAAVPLFEQLVAACSGFVCADSEDFNPVYAGSSKK